MGRVPRELWIALALLATFWVLAGLNFKPGREPTASRYQLPGVIFVLMIAAELLATHPEVGAVRMGRPLRERPRVCPARRADGRDDLLHRHFLGLQGKRVDGQIAPSETSPFANAARPSVSSFQ